MFSSCHVRATEAMSRNSLLKGGAESKVLNDWNWTRTQSPLVRKRTLNHFAQLAKWLSCVLCTYLYSAFDCLFLSRHVRISEWIHILQLPEFQGTGCLKQARNLKFKWLQLDSNPELLILETNNEPFMHTGQMTELCSEFISVRSVWLYVLVLSRMCFRVNRHSIVARMSRNPCLKQAWSLRFNWLQLHSKPGPFSS